MAATSNAATGWGAPEITGADFLNRKETRAGSVWAGKRTLLYKSSSKLEICVPSIAQPPGTVAVHSPA